MNVQPIETAPKDGTRVLLRVEHMNAKYSDDPVAEGWIADCSGYWTDFNGGGWVWSGLAGRITGWMPAPETPNE